MAEKLPPAPRFSVNSKDLQAVFDAYADYLDLLTGNTDINAVAPVGAGQDVNVYAGRGLTHNHDGRGGISFEILEDSPDTEADSQPFAFEVVLKDAATREVWVRPGTLSGFIPTISGEELVALLDEDAPVLTLGTSDQCIYLQADVDGDHLVTAVSVHSTEDPSPPESTETTIYAMIAAVTINEEESISFISNTVGYSLGVRWCFGSWDVYAGA